MDNEYNQDVMMTTFEWLLVHIMILACSRWLVIAHCPTTCECKWKNGKETVLCKSNNFTDIPLYLDSGTQVLDLSDNLFEEVQRDVFQESGLLNLQKIYLNKCKIKTIDRYAFRKLINLIELDLSYNLIQYVPSHIFDSILELRELKLSGNPIQKVSNEAFINVPKLMRLELSDCKITFVESRAFAGLENSLEWLKIDRNKVINVRPVTLTSLNSLKGIELYGNFWNCSCNLRPLREWLLRNNIPLGVPPTCKYPSNMASKSWEKLSLEEFACSPSIRTFTPAITVEENENVTLSCRVTGSPIPKIKWIFKDKIIANISSGLANMNKRHYIIKNINSLSNITILAVTMLDSGLYTCKAKNGAGEVFTNISLNVIRVETAVAQSDPTYLVASLTTVVTIILTACLVVLCFIILKSKRKTRAQNRRYYLEEKMEYSQSTSKPIAISKIEAIVPTNEIQVSVKNECDITLPHSDTVRRPEKKPNVKHVQDSVDRSASVYYNCNIGDVALGHHVLRKEVLPAGGGALYTTASPAYPDLLENYSSSNSAKSTSDIIFSKNSSNYPKVSDSQSPLLPNSRYGSSGGESSTSESNRALLSSDYVSRSVPYYRLSNHGRSNSTTSMNTLYSSHQPHHYTTADGKTSHLSLRRKYRYENSLPTSPSRETPLLNLLDTRSYSPPLSSAYYSPTSPTMRRSYQYHHSQLDMFLQEYKTLQTELNRMKKTCDSLSYANPSTSQMNPKSILKKRTKHSDLDTYWNHGKPLTRRLSESEFYQS